MTPDTNQGGVVVYDGPMRSAHLLDLPSEGDTCFVAKPTDGPAVSWREGRRGPSLLPVRLAPRG